MTNIVINDKYKDIMPIGSPRFLDIRTDENKVEMRKAYCHYRLQKSRCNNPTNNRYYCYGAKGITVSYSLREFTEWWLANKPKTNEKWTIGRIDHSKGYSFCNIRFETATYNNRESIVRNNGANRLRLVAKRRERSVLAKKYPCMTPVGVYRSIKIAKIALGVYNIDKIISGEYKQENGYTFEYF